MQLEGKLHVKYDTVQVSEKFARREFVLETALNPMYPQHVKLELVQDKCGLIDKLNKGDKLIAHINIKGREYTDKTSGEMKYFTSIEAWKIEVLEQKAESVEDIARRSPALGGAENWEDYEGDAPPF